MHFSLNMSFVQKTYRSKNCKTCENCLKDNCNWCINCTTPSRKQKCIFRECLNPEPKRVTNNTIYETNEPKIAPKLYQPDNLQDISKVFLKKIVKNKRVKACDKTSDIVDLMKELISQEKTFSADSLCDKNHAF